MGEFLLEHRRAAILTTIALCCAAALYLLLAPGDSDDAAPFAPIADAAEKTASFPGARVDVDATFESDQLSEPLVMKGRGAFNGETNRFSMSMHAVDGPPGVDLALADQVAVGSGSVIYMRSPAFEGSLPDGASWMSMDTSEFASEQTQQETTSDPRDALADLRGLTDVEEVGTETVTGAQTTHYRGTMDPSFEVDRLRAEGRDDEADTLETILEGAGEPVPGGVEVWIDEKDRVRRMAMQVPFEAIGGEGASMAMTMTYSDFGVTPEISLPPQDDVFDGTQLGIESAEALSE